MSNTKLDSPEVMNQMQSYDDQPSLLHRVMQWLAEERSKRATRCLNPGDLLHDSKTGETKSHDHDQDLALDKLEHILASYAANAVASAARNIRRQSTAGLKRGSIARKFMRTQSGIGTATSDTDGADVIARVPHVEAVLDNTKTLGFSKGAADDDNDEAAKTKEQKNWDAFKYEILRLTHTLKLRGWKRLPLEHGPLIHVERLSGALTNAVYVVRAPKDVELYRDKDENGALVPVQRMPKDLLLRIYGPQVEHLIDRDAELMILRRLAAKNIGPKLLGYFSNGRFEEFLHAKTLEYEDLRDPSTSKQIAKRMKELHEGVELLEKERDDGPFVFLNWDKWVNRVEKVITWLDQQVKNEEAGRAPASTRYTRRGLICGVEWQVFRHTYDKYRKLLVKECGGTSHVRDELVFAHNDTQYGNLMRLQPPEESPLLHAINQHKQLVVIDFEYANANLPGLEFANHFTEWCYNYHSKEANYSCNTTMYPTPEEQYRFVRAYVMHRPQFAPSASSTPMMEGREKTNVPDFMLDARAPTNYDAEEKARERTQEAEIQRLLHQTRMWRTANSAQWVAWGIVQAKVPELADPPGKNMGASVLEKIRDKLHAHSDPLDPDVAARREDAKHDRPESREKENEHHEGDGEHEAEESFDYLAYAQERAMFFWGDCIQMGIVKERDLPAAMRSQIKYVRY